MKKSIIFIMTVIMGSMALLGCGSSSDANNPIASSTNGNIRIKGAVSNVRTSAKVELIKAEDVMKRATGIRAAVAENSIYTTYTDDKGNYSFNVPEGTYSVKASEGDKVAVSELTRFARNNSDSVTAKEIYLNEVKSIKGNVDSSFCPIKEKIVVAIENMPFMAVTDASGYFLIENLPVRKEPYTFVAFAQYRGIKYSGSQILESDVQDFVSILIHEESEPSKGQEYSISGKVVDEKGINLSGENVYAVLPYTNQVISAVTDENGYKLTFNLESQSESPYVFVSLNFDDSRKIDLPTSGNLDITKTTTTESSGTVIKVNFNAEASDNQPFGLLSKTKLFILSDNNQKVAYEEDVLLPLVDFSVSNLPVGNYSAVLISESIASFGIAVSDYDYLDNNLELYIGTNNTRYYGKAKVVLDRVATSTPDPTHEPNPSIPSDWVYFKLMEDTNLVNANHMLNGVNFYFKYSGVCRTQELSYVSKSDLPVFNSAGQDGSSNGEYIDGSFEGINGNVRQYGVYDFVIRTGISFEQQGSNLATTFLSDTQRFQAE